MHKIARTARVAFQGEPGAFSQIAARQLLGDAVQTVPCPTFESLFGSIAEERADLILAPLENTLAGPVLRCYDLLYQGSQGPSALTMIGEVVLRISHCVIGCPGSSLDAIRRIQSHPVALAQCEQFLRRPPRHRQGRRRRHRWSRPPDHAGQLIHPSPPSPANSPPANMAPKSSPRRRGRSQQLYPLCAASAR